MDENKNNKVLSKLGLICVAAGSAIGLGSIWRFPYLVAEHSGGTFIFSYIFFSFFIGFSIVLSEFIIGRYLGHPFLDGIKHKIKYSAFFSKAIYLNLITLLILISFYFVVTSWTFYYFINSLIGVIKYNNNSIEYYQNIFGNLMSNPLILITFSFIVTISTVVVNLKGLVAGVEKINFIFLPALFIILIILMVRILSLNNAYEGLKYIFTFNIKELPSAIVPSLGQAIFSLSIGVSAMIVFGSHTNSHYNLKSSALTTVLLCTLSGIFASFLIIPAVVSFGYDMSSGPGLTFLTLPKIFSLISFGKVFATLFFFIVAMAAFTTTISIIETGIPYISRLFKTKRSHSIWIISIYCFVSNIVMSLSLNVWKDVKLFGLDLFSLASGPLIDNILITGVILVILTLAIGLTKEIIKNEITNYGSIKFNFFNTWLFITIFITPLVIISTVIYSMIG